MAHTSSSRTTGSTLIDGRKASIVTPSTISAHDPATSKSGAHVMSSINTGLHPTSSSSMAHIHSSVQHLSLPSVSGSGLNLPIPSTGPYTAPSTGTYTAPSTDPNTTPSTGQYTTTSTGPNTTPSICPNTAPSTGPNPTPSTNPNTTPSTGPNITTSTNPNTTPSTGPNTAQYTGPNTAPSTGPNTTPSTDPNTTPSTDPNTATSNCGARPKITASAICICSPNPITGGNVVTPATTCNNTLCEQINKEYVVNVGKLEFVEYCFELKTDFEAKKSDKHKSRAALSQKQFAIVGLVLTALMNTCGGFLALLNMRNARSKILDEWRNNLNKQMQYIPKWIYKACVSMPILKQTARLRHTKDIMMFVKKSPRTITYNTHMFVRRPDGNSELADSDGLISVLQVGGPTKYTPHHTTEIFTTGQSFQYDQELPPESMYIEYKHWQVNNVNDIINKIKKVRNTKSLFSLANNLSGGVYVIGVDDESCQVKGLGMLSRADQAEFRAGLTSWMTVDDVKNQRIWGSEGHAPCEGADDDWKVTFIPIHNCPDRKMHHLIVIHMHHCPGGMFECVPECYQVNDAGKIIALLFEKWKQRILRELDTNFLNEFYIQSKSSPMTLPSPAVTLPSPTVTLSSPGVSLPSPAVTLSSPTVTLPSPAVTLPSPAVSQPSPSMTLSAPDLSKGSATALAEVNKNYHSASWTKCGKWKAFLTKVVVDEDSLRCSQMSAFQLSSPLALVPSKEHMMLSYPPDQVNAIVDELNNKYPNVHGVALTFQCLAEIFDTTLSIIPPINHVFDTLILNDLSLEVWSSYSNALSHSKNKQRKAYGFEICRIIKRYTLERTQQSTQHIAVNLVINSYIFTTTTRTLESFKKSGDSLHEHYMFCLGHTEGIVLEHVLTQLVNNTVSKVVWLKNRINKDMSCHLTQQQCEVFLKFCNDWILVIEAAPGCGKSVMAAYICQRFGEPNEPEHVLYISPRKGFAAIVKHQGNAKTYVACDESTLQKVISVIQKANYKVIVMDDIQAMSCSQSIWDRLLDTVHSKRARLLLLMDSEFQDFHNSGSCKALRARIDTFCKKKNIPRPTSHTLTTNMRNSQKVFSFLVAQIYSHQDASSQGGFKCGHDIEGDDVHIRVIYNPWKDSGDNDLIQLVTKLITQQGEHRYELRDIVLLVDDTDPQVAEKLRRIFSTHSAFSTCQAFNIPHSGLVVDLVDEFIGMEAQVCIVILSNHMLHNMKYRIFTASRGIMRTELVFVDDISADLVKAMAWQKLKAGPP